eukprot:3293617-Rhodomonas_salina.2
MSCPVLTWLLAYAFATVTPQFKTPPPSGTNYYERGGCVKLGGHGMPCPVASYLFSYAISVQYWPR